MLTEKEKRNLAILIVLLVVGILWFVAWLELQMILLARAFFWITLFLIPIGFFGGIIFFIFGINEDDDDGFFHNSNKDGYYLIALILGIIFIFSIFTIDNFYRKGYSEEALQREAELRGNLEEYEAIISLFVSPVQIVEEITNQAIEETIDDLCQDENYPCDQMKLNYGVYKNIKGAKDTADSIAKFMWIK